MTTSTFTVSQSWNPVTCATVRSLRAAYCWYSGVSTYVIFCHSHLLSNLFVFVPLEVHRHDGAVRFGELSDEFVEGVVQCGVVGRLVVVGG